MANDSCSAEKAIYTASLLDQNFLMEANDVIMECIRTAWNENASDVGSFVTNVKQQNDLTGPNGSDFEVTFKPDGSFEWTFK